MTQYTNTHDSYDLKGGREDLEEAIYDISPLDTPCISAIGRMRAKAVKHEWQIDVLAAAAANAHIEGDEITIADTVPTKRISNMTQISLKSLIVSGTADAVRKAGRRSELGYGLAKKTRELKRDVEVGVCQNAPWIDGSGTVARQSAGMEVWIHTNSYYPADGSDAGFTNEQPDDADTITDGTARAFTEDLMKSALSAAWTAGGDPNMIVLGAFNKQALSGFTGGNTRTDKSEDKRLTAAVDVYVSDFGTHRVVASRFCRASTCLILDTSMWAMGYLRNFQTFPLGKSGDANKRVVLAEWTLTAKNEAASASVMTLTTS